jgi:hypothetical protein
LGFREENGILKLTSSGYQSSYFNLNAGQNNLQIDLKLSISFVSSSTTATTTTPTTTPTITTTTTTTTTSTTTTTTDKPGKLPLTKATIWLTTTQNAFAPHVTDFKIGTEDNLHIWVEAEEGMQGAFTVWATYPSGTRAQCGAVKTASAGKQTYCGTLTSAYLNLNPTGTLTVEVVSNDKVVGSTSIDIHK